MTSYASQMTLFIIVYSETTLRLDVCWLLDDSLIFLNNNKNGFIAQVTVTFTFLPQLSSASNHLYSPCTTEHMGRLFCTMRGGGFEAWFANTA